MYNIEKMRLEKEIQMKKRAKIDKVVNCIVECSNRKLAAVKIMSLVYLIVGQPIVFNYVAGNVELESYNTIFSILCGFILLLKEKDFNNKEGD